MIARGKLWCVLAVELALGCALARPPEKPDPALLGCYRLSPDLSARYRDSLPYAIPKTIELQYWPSNQWQVMPTDFEYHPSWSIYDALPSTILDRTRRQRWPMHIAGDSIDVRFPGPLGSLYFRLGRDGEALGGRAAWVTDRIREFPANVHVVAEPTDCSTLARSLKRR